MKVFTLNSRVADCPFCGNVLAPLVDAEPLRCSRCGDYSAKDGDLLRPLESSAMSATFMFRAPIFKNARWPKGCVACGAPPTRCQRVTTPVISPTHLIAAWLIKAVRMPKGAPYCDDHRDRLQLAFTFGRQAYLGWCSLGMMRRYLAVNRESVRSRSGLW